MTRGRTTRGRRSEGPLVVYGANVVGELLRSGQSVERLCLGRGPREGELAEAARRRGVRVEPADRSTLDRLAGSPQHQGAVAVVAAFPYAPLEQVLEAKSALLLDGIQDPRNLGAILRAARASGVGGVLLPRDRSSPVTATVVAASAGLVFGLPVVQVTNLARSADALKEAGFWLVALVARDGQPLDRLDPPARPALVLGSEGEGIRPLVRRSCDFVATIPMAPGVESFNVAVAAGIALYELLLRRKRS